MDRREAQERRARRGNVEKIEGRGVMERNMETGGGEVDNKVEGRRGKGWAVRRENMEAG